MTELTLYTHPYSRGRVVRWVLEELGVDYNVEVKEFGTSIKAPDYLALNPMGKVPTLVHGEAIVTEVGAICTYLADRFAEKGLAPAIDDPVRATYLRWLFFMAGPFEMATSAIAYGWNIDADNAPAVSCGFPDSTVEALASALEKGPYICGERFTAADILVSSYIGWEMMLQKNLPERPVFLEYVQRMEARPAAQRANELDDALVAEINT